MNTVYKIHFKTMLMKKKMVKIFENKQKTKTVQQITVLRLFINAVLNS